MDELNDYARGILACQKGEECPEGSSSEFERGYNDQYYLEQMRDSRSEVACLNQE